MTSGWAALLTKVAPCRSCFPFIFLVKSYEASCLLSLWNFYGNVILFMIIMSILWLLPWQHLPLDFDFDWQQSQWSTQRRHHTVLLLEWKRSITNVFTANLVSEIEHQITVSMPHNCLFLFYRRSFFWCSLARLGVHITQHTFITV